ncbi:MAG: acetylornithine deacetylase [Bacteroidetes bacterium GWE2_40_63]|nr:MAG: acetylornithine deacetylase [Bacteroidetes bacterium GWC2_40_13]OFX72875.1 MAG: acetylornithine deacetylase [Bacteroidetes bacterium GWD2_40_43]OFX93569.1 MAG: acetylornithine deacetylase [Bacteroidetes bacterium GWE2_40_63]OFY18284.1 MAG: acetylornithine deacetylase [Bacteroidetes bacterium GWF2_40_13]OFZ27536.1 MAG: acetylornithine deacetylase [Bacteroidetes bacterium RIFOXYC2_FULL_40_12]HBX83888.1 acetylornithine deacetylase [Marinilabiliales bacterium]
MQKLDITSAQQLAADTLVKLIQMPSFSREEEKASKLIAQILEQFHYRVHFKGNNIYAYSRDFVPGRFTLMLNSHLDTVRPTNGWETDPFNPILENGKLTGLGSNDAGGCLVSLLASFLLSEDLNLNYNRVFVATAEEEISGTGGMEFVLPELGKIDVGIVGEPTQMQMAVAEKGLMVLDCEAKGKSGHAARTGGINAITEAIKDIEWFHSFRFPETSTILGDVKMTVTQIHAGSQHNVIPDKCTFVVDVRTNEKYNNAQTLEIISLYVKSHLQPRSLRMNSSCIAENHPLVLAAKSLQIVCFGSPTTSDQSVISNFPTVKMGPGDSNRSHTANEYIFVDEINHGIETYLGLLKAMEV